MAHPPVLLTVALLAGMAGGVSLDVPIALGGAVVMSAAWAAAVLCYRRDWPRAQAGAVAVLVAGAGWVSGAHAVEQALHPPLRTLLEQRFGGFAIEAAVSRLDEPLVVEGRLEQDAEPTPDGARLRMAVERIWVNGAGEAVRGGVALSVAGALHVQHLAEWTAGRRVRAPVWLRRPARYFNAGLPDQERALARRGVSLVGTIKSASLVEVLARGRWWEEAGAAVRARTRAALRRHVEGARATSAAIATAILIGDRAGLDPMLERRLQEAGTYHVIAISGGNIAILAGLLLGVLASAGVRGRAAALLTILGLTAYAVVATSGPSVLRATLMAIVYLVARVIDQRTAAVNAISVTAALLLLATPLAIVDVGFWLTFGATVALVVAASLVARAGGQKASTSGPSARSRAAVLVARAAQAAAAVLVGTVCVELALAPIAALIFQRVTVAGLLLNFVALPAMSVVQVGAMAVVALDLLAFDAPAAWAGQGVHLASLVLTESARLLDVAPWLTWRVPSPSVPVCTAYYALLVAVVVHATLPPALVVRRLSQAALLALFAWIVVAPQARVRAAGDGRLHVSVLDVGQGDATLVTFPNGRTLLVDAGGLPAGAFDIGDRVVGPALRSLGLLRLDYLAVSHPDADHVGGARAILRDFAPQELWWGVPVAGHEPTTALRIEAERQRTVWRTLQRGDRLDAGGVDVRLHHPPLPEWERQRVRNNDSLVMELRYGEVSVLLTGDIERDVEEQLVPGLDLGTTVVLKVAHHGSATSSTRAFLDQARPAIAVISTGRGNTYGHPAPHVMGRLHDAGAEIFRTDLDGQVNVITDGRRVAVGTWTGRSFRR